MRRRGWLVAGAAVVLVVGLVGAALWPRPAAPAAPSPAPTGTSSPSPAPSPPPPGPASPSGRAQAAFAALLHAYRAPSGVLAANPGPGGHYGAGNRPHPTAVWGYTWALAAAEDVAQLPGAPASARATVRSLAAGLAPYWDARATVPAYSPYPQGGPHTTKFYDDNAWAGLDLVGAYRLTGDHAFLAQAERVMRYEQTGWDAAGGGIYWNDQHLTRNTPSNAPVAELAAYLYLATHRPSDLRWAERIYAWQESTLVDPRTGQVWDHINAGGQIQHSLWTYNLGTVIGAGALLYHITGHAAYLAQAQRTAAFALAHAVFVNGILLPQAEFNGVLADNLQLLNQVRPDPAIAHLIAVNAASAWTRARSGPDLFAQNWSGPPPVPATVKLLQQTGAVRLLAVAAALAHGRGFAGYAL